MRWIVYITGTVSVIVHITGTVTVHITATVHTFFLSCGHVTETQTVLIIVMKACDMIVITIDAQSDLSRIGLLYGT
jgi:hypothetical protein